jgi:hypothetical protein
MANPRGRLRSPCAGGHRSTSIQLPSGAFFTRICAGIRSASGVRWVTTPRTRWFVCKTSRAWITWSFVGVECAEALVDEQALHFLAVDGMGFIARLPQFRFHVVNHGRAEIRYES